jgi:para-nitrobenzyl esterase
MADGQRPVVAFERGRVRGVVEGPVVAFRGIPYAASPVGELRFAAPAPHPGWADVRDAARSGPAAPQGPSRLEAVMGRREPDWAEDGCLNLNVWAPAGALAEGAAPRPVLLWWHGGGFSSGSGGWAWYDGARLAARGDVVVVTANYRLGPLGYLYLPGVGTGSGTVNLGSRDQGAALSWVRDNIAAFGGDPGRITVGGQSAGAHSALALAVDPATRDLVHGVIAQSGPWGWAPADPGEAAETAADYLRILGVDAAGDVGGQLRALPAGRLLAGYAELAVARARPGNIAPPMYPALGPGLPVALSTAVRDGALAGRNLLVGAVEHEMAAFFAPNPAVQALDRDEVLGLLAAELGEPAAAERAYADRAAGRPEVKPARILTELVTDRMFTDGVTELAEQCTASGGSAYAYRFSRRPPGDDGTLGAVHCAELPFVFDTLDAFPDAPMLGAVGDGDRALARAVSGAFAAFVRTGSPNAAGLADWAPHRPGSTAALKRFGPG